MGSEYVTKSRTLHHVWPADYNSYLRALPGSGLSDTLNLDAPSLKPIKQYETITTRGNPGWNRGPGHYDQPKSAKRKWPNTDRGGNCVHIKYTFGSEPAQPARYAATALYDWESPIWTSPRAANGALEYTIPWGFPPLAEDAALDVLGTNLASIVNPTKPRASLFTTLIELYREGLPNLRSALLASKSLRGVGDDWLNFAFGLKPLWNDLMSTCQALMEAEQLMLQFQQDAGKLVRRGTERRPIVIYDRHNAYPDTVGYPYGPGPSYRNGGIRSVDEKYTNETWFRGAFKYSVPFDPSLLGQMKYLNQSTRYLLGLSFDPKTLWSVLGWSWLVDWIFNVGPVLENFTQTYMNNSVMAYGYMMSYNETRVDESLTGVTLNSPGGGIKVADAFCTETWSTFKRRQATPFGFGLNWTGFSPFQLSIIASLGITRGRP